MRYVMRCATWVAVELAVTPLVRYPGSVMSISGCDIAIRQSVTTDARGQFTLEYALPSARTGVSHPASATVPV